MPGNLVGIVEVQDREGHAGINRAIEQLKNNLAGIAVDIEAEHNAERQVFIVRAIERPQLVNQIVFENNVFQWGAIPQLAVHEDWRMRPPVEPEPAVEYAKNGPEYWDKLLYAVREIYECEAIVAGGAVRDHLLGFDPKDIDIFVNYTNDPLELSEELGWGHPKQIGNRGRRNPYANIKGKIVQNVLEFYPSTSPVPVQLIFTKKPLDGDFTENTLNMFDFHICKSAYDGKMYDTEVAQQERLAKTFTYSGPEDEENKEKSMQRFESFKQRHPEFKVVGLNNIEKVLEEKQKKAKEQPFYLNFKKERW